MSGIVISTFNTDTRGCAGWDASEIGSGCGALGGGWGHSVVFPVISVISVLLFSYFLSVLLYSNDLLCEALSITLSTSSH